MIITHNIWIANIEEDEVSLEDDKNIHHTALLLGDLCLWFKHREDILLLREKLGEYLDLTKCEFCDLAATTTAPDELGNDCRVCDAHVEMLANKTAARTADRKYEEEHKS